MTDSTTRPMPRRIDEPIQTAFLAALREGHRREDAAAIVGFSLMGLYGARQRNPAFAAAWREALASTCVADRRPPRLADQGEVRIAAANRRLYQRRRRRHVRFDLARQERFLACFAQGCDTKAAAAAAGVHHSTVNLRRRTDRAFAEAFQAALADGYLHLEAEAVRQGLAAQARLRAAIEAGHDRSRFGPRDGLGAPEPAACPACGQLPAAEAAAAFDHVMKLLARHDRKPRRVEQSFKPGGRRQRWSFDEAIEALDKKLRALGLRREGKG